MAERQQIVIAFAAVQVIGKLITAKMEVLFFAARTIHIGDMRAEREAMVAKYRSYSRLACRWKQDGGPMLGIVERERHRLFGIDGGGKPILGIDPLVRAWVFRFAVDGLQCCNVVR